MNGRSSASISWLLQFDLTTHEHGMRTATLWQARLHSARYSKKDPLPPVRRSEKGVSEGFVMWCAARRLS